ncbi:MAG: response regulator transcription factor [Chloroflexota bacterium]
MDYLILLVEDDDATAEMVRFYLEQDRFKFERESNGADALAQVDLLKPHLVILDMMLPGLDGLKVCEEIRKGSTVPILMLTARQSDVDKALAFGIGADDYLTKPFSTTELISRVRALIRRSYEFVSPVAADTQSKVLGGPALTLDVSRHLITYKDKLIETTPVEFAILEALMEAPGWVCSRDQLLQRIWPSGEEAVEETVTVHVSNLRQKLGPEAARFIRTVRGVGYVYEEEPPPAP